jgi:negative regulator of flagellin synthesis FlgM
MRVNPNVNPNIQGTKTEGPKKTEQTAQPERARQIEQLAKTKDSSGPARAEISDKGKEFAKAHAAASAAPDVRESRIAELKKRIADGNYKIDSDKIADRMMSEHSADL